MSEEELHYNQIQKYRQNYNDYKLMKKNSKTNE